jgi:release factor glutamine methyltransferase
MTERALPATEPRSTADVLRGAVATLKAAGVESAQLDARLLLAHCLGDVPVAQLLTTAAIDGITAQRFAELLARRADREPLQYLLGNAPFRHLMINVGPGVFIPRPETELLVDAVLPSLRRFAAPVVVDLCSGSGALALALAYELPSARVLAVESEPAALRWLRQNCAGTGVVVLEADVRDLDRLAGHAGSADAVVCNPPYVPLGAPVGAEVAHDPATAVYAGTDGLALMAPVIDAAAMLLDDGAIFALEHDESHGSSVPDLLRRHGGWASISDHHDLTGRDRYGTAVRRR